MSENSTVTEKLTVDQWREKAEKETANVGAVKEYQRRVWRVQAALSSLNEHLRQINSDDSELSIAIECLASVLPQKADKAQAWLNIHEARASLYTDQFLAALFYADRL